MHFAKDGVVESIQEPWSIGHLKKKKWARYTRISKAKISTLNFCTPNHTEPKGEFKKYKLGLSKIGLALKIDLIRNASLLFWAVIHNLFI